MPEFVLRAWEEQILSAYKDYVVEADLQEAALALLQALLDQAVDTGRPVAHPAVRASERGQSDAVTELDPTQIVRATGGVKPLRHAFRRLETHVEPQPTGSAT